ncbi:esterase FE4-like [Epargyreus clarus]|uniref:esterase FE4-like n=1 Tax=Epargyreus clarus TaxID=520877 RepID=UPI003C2E3CB3
MWKSIPWLIVLITLIRGTVSVKDGVQVSPIYPDAVRNKTNTIDEVAGGAPEEPSPTPGDENETEGGNVNGEKVIVTKQGPVRGYQIKNTNIWQFLDIPYAAFDPDNPFQAPTKPESWDTEHDITEHSSLCPQVNSDEAYVGITDCLTLSVFMPRGAKDADILFHIHDGGFIRGSGDPRIYGPGHLVTDNIILVLPNYRLGALGFLCLQNNIAPGNAALKDLSMALNWTSENIELFGGNPANIVVSGSGTGAALAQYLILSSTSQEYVSKVITESGFVLSHWAIDRAPLVTANELIKRLNESRAEIAKGSNILSNSSVEKIILASKGLIFRPCVEKEGFLTDTPWNLLRDQKLNKSFMLGAADRPGLHKAMQHTEESVSALNQDFGLLLPNDLTFDEREEEKETGKRVKIQYFGNNTITLEHRNELALCHSDCSYLSPGIRNARLLIAAGATVYLYEFSFVSNTAGRNNHIVGAVQGDSLNFVFERQGHIPDEGSEEYKIKKLMTDFWITFIRTGSPTSEGVEWNELKKTNESEEVWLSIGSSPEEKKGFHLDRLSLWTEIYNDHFIEHNLGNQAKPCIFSTCLVLLIGFVKNLRH